MGRRAHKPTDQNRKTVKLLALAGTDRDVISKVIGVSKATLYKYYEEEINEATFFANANVANMLYKQCMKGNVTALIFWCKTRLRWRETERLGDGVGEEGIPPLHFYDAPDVDLDTPQELEDYAPSRS